MVNASISLWGLIKIQRLPDGEIIGEERLVREEMFIKKIY